MDSARPSLYRAELSPKEAKVAVLAGMGFSSKYIARHLSLSPRTVETHIHNIYGKLQLSSRDELIVKVFGEPDLR